MGINCEINLFKPSTGAYLAGSIVSGVIKYAIDEETIFDKITVSLKGFGRFVVRDRYKKGDNQSNVLYRNKEVHVDVDNVIENEKKIPHDVGMYETRLDFKLPDNIPSSLNYRGKTGRYKVKCKIIYYVRIKFDRPGLLQFAKRFKKELTVISGIKPELSNEPTIYGEQKKLFQLFARKDNIVNIKAIIKNSVIPIGGKVDLEYEVHNDTNLVIKGVETKLVEIYTFTSKNGKKIKARNHIDDTETKTACIRSGDKQNCDIVIIVPSDKVSLGFSKIVSRNYYVRISAELPFPHTDATLKIPIEIDELDKDIEAAGPSQVQYVGKGVSDYDNPPPSYWEAMGEETNDDDFENEKGWEKS